MKSNELPVFVFSRASMKGDSDGIYVFTGSGACAMTMGPGSTPQIFGIDTAGIRIIKNRGSATVTVTANIFDAAAVASLAITAGQGVVFVWDGTYWSTVGKAN